MKNFILVIIFLFLINNIKGQNVGIGTNDPKARLHVADSPVVFTGAGFPIGDDPNPPISGIGHRLMWFPQRAALRVGGVIDKNWNRDSIGYFSFAAGFDTRAKGNNSIALGNGAIAYGLSSVALGSQTIASGPNSTAMGISTTASGGNAVAMGSGNVASGPNSTAMGNFTNATGSLSTSMGYSTTASNTGSTAMGYGSAATGQYSTSMGAGNQATNTYSVSMGVNSVASGSASTAMGATTLASGSNSTATGTSTEAAGYSSFVAGMYNEPIVSAQTTFSTTTPLFIIGNGDDNATRSNAVVVRKNGRVGIGSNSPVTKLHVDGGSDASYNDNSGYLVLGDVAGTNIVFDNNEIIGRNNGAASNLFLQAAGGNVIIGTGTVLNPTYTLSINGTAGKTGGGTWASYSDARLKQDVHPYPDGLKTLLKIKPVWYRYNDISGFNTDTKYVGVLAQELQRAAPYMVSVAENKSGNPDDYLQVDNSSMIYMLVNAVKEQQKQIEDLKRSNEKLKRLIKTIGK